MFTGIVECTATVLRVHPSGLSIDASTLSDFDVKVGDSVAVNGACLTATPSSRLDVRQIDFDIGPTTWALTQLGELKAGHQVNIERAMRLDQRLGGHIVTGHIDGIAEVVSVRPEGDFHYLDIKIPQEFARLMVLRGSCCLNGVSLTIAGTEDKGATLSFMIIPETWGRTNLGQTRPGSKLNLEVDTLAKWMERLSLPR